MPKHELTTLCAELDVQPTQPDELGAIEILLNTILPDCTQERYREIIEKRCVVPKDPLLEFADPDVLEAMFPEDDAQIVEDHKKRSLAAQEEAQAFRAAVHTTGRGQRAEPPSKKKKTKLQQDVLSGKKGDEHQCRTNSGASKCIHLRNHGW